MVLRGCCCLILAFALLAFVARPAQAYAVGPAVALEELSRASDVVCKATVVGDRPVADASFPQLPGFEVRETELRIVSVLKGQRAKRFLFHHYAPKVGAMVLGYEPQVYTPTSGRTYLVFAKSAPGGRPEVIRQVSTAHTTKADQGLILAADDKPHRGATVTDAVWSELRGLLASADPADATYAMTQLDAMSGGAGLGLKDLDRGQVLAAIRPLILHQNSAIATTAIGIFGADSPYFVDGAAPYWLAGIGKGRIPGLAARVPVPNPTAGAAVKELLAVANSPTNPELRALALRALGRSNVVTAAQIAALGADREVVVRRAAVLLSADLTDHKLIQVGTTDGAPEVRGAAALAIGFSQDPSLVPLLGKLLDDGASSVRRSAAMSLLSFAPDKARPTLEARLTSNYGPLFVNALARVDARPYLSNLAEVIEKHPTPSDWWGGMIPAGDSWEILYRYVKNQPASDLTSGKLDRSLYALERMKWFSSSEPRALYALYLSRGLPARAKSFRDVTRKAVTYNIDLYFDMADKSPETYVR